jgi:hypothetical protein
VNDTFCAVIDAFPRLLTATPSRFRPISLLLSRDLPSNKMSQRPNPAVSSELDLALVLVLVPVLAQEEALNDHR